MTFDEALAALLALVGKRVEVHVMDAGETPHLVATFGGRLRAGYSMTGGEPSDNEAMFVRLDAGEGRRRRSALVPGSEPFLAIWKPSYGHAVGVWRVIRRSA